MASKFSLRELHQQYGTHSQCLAAIKDLRFPAGSHCPKCRQKTNFYPVSGRTAYACPCGWHIYPLVGTIFEKTSTPLDLWFFALYLIIQTQSRTSAKQLERMLGVTYKTAWRINNQLQFPLGNEPTARLRTFQSSLKRILQTKPKSPTFSDFFR